MLGRRSSTKARIADAADTVGGYVDPLAHDEKLRERLATAIVAGAAARRRMQQHTGLAGLVRRLAADPVLRAQVVEIGAALQSAQKRAEKVRSHRLRNVILLLTAAGTALALRGKVTSLLGGGSGDAPATAVPPSEVGVEPVT